MAELSKGVITVPLLAVVFSFRVLKVEEEEEEEKSRRHGRSSEQLGVERRSHTRKKEKARWHTPCRFMSGKLQ